MLMVPAQNMTGPGIDLGSIPVPDLSGCDPSVLTCFANITTLISPTECGIPPASALSTSVDVETLKWAQCACPKLLPIFEWYL